MKKKLVDLTVADIIKICIPRKNCFDCPYRKVCHGTPSGIDNIALNEEVEVPDED